MGYSFAQGHRRIYPTSSHDSKFSIPWATATAVMDPNNTVKIHPAAQMTVASANLEANGLPPFPCLLLHSALKNPRQDLGIPVGNGD